MSAGKTAARDLRYGRRGGRWAEGDTRMETLLADMHRIRLAYVRRGEWPTASLNRWLELADQAAEHLAASRPIDETLQRALEVADAHRKAAAA